MQGRGAPRLPRTGPTTPPPLFPWEPGIDSLYFIYASYCLNVSRGIGGIGKGSAGGAISPSPPPPESPSRAPGARAKSGGFRGEGSGRESAVSMATALASKDARALLSLRPGPAPDRPSLGPLLGAQQGNGRSSRASQLPPPSPTFATPTRRPRAAAAKKRSASLRRSCGALLRPPEEQSEALPGWKQTRFLQASSCVAASGPRIALVAPPCTLSRVSTYFFILWRLNWMLCSQCGLTKAL